jgi:hypothetical protein
VVRENLKFSAELIFETEKLENIPCEVVFPKRQDEKVVLKAQFKANRFPPLEIPFVFSLNGTISNQTGNLLEIFAKKVYNLGIETSYFGTNQEFSILEAEVVDLKIREFIQQPDTEENQKNFYFWLTQSVQLAPISYPKFHYNGNVSVTTHRSKSFEIIEGLKFNFINYYFHHNDPQRKNTRISESVLAAEFVGVTEHELGESLFPEIEIFLKLVSFSERRRVVCYGYKGFLSGEKVKFYRRDISIPKEDFNHSSNETLIEIREFEEFISQALSSGRSCIFKEHLFDAIGKVAYREDSSLESEYLSYYSALENLVNGYRDSFNFHYILEDDSWKRFSKDLKVFIKAHDFFKTEEDNNTRKRQFIYEKISELNRVSFGTALKLFCDFYNIDLSDLWSLGGGVSTSLSTIRNRLIHGGRFEREEYDAVICAKSHLKWTLERCILRVLDWEIERSKVRPLFLKQCIHYNDWEEKMTFLKS